MHACMHTYVYRQYYFFVLITAMFTLGTKNGSASKGSWTEWAESSDQSSQSSVSPAVGTVRSPSIAEKKLGIFRSDWKDSVLFLDDREAPFFDHGIYVDLWSQQPAFDDRIQKNHTTNYWIILDIKLNKTRKPVWVITSPVFLTSVLVIVSGLGRQNFLSSDVHQAVSWVKSRRVDR